MPSSFSEPFGFRALTAWRAGRSKSTPDVAEYETERAAREVMIKAAETVVPGSIEYFEYMILPQQPPVVFHSFTNKCLSLVPSPTSTTTAPVTWRVKVPRGPYQQTQSATMDHFRFSGQQGARLQSPRLRCRNRDPESCT